MILGIFVLGITAVPLGASQQIPQAPQTAPIQKQDKAQKDAEESATEQKALSPSEVVIKGPVEVVGKPDPKEEQRDADSKAQTRFENGVQVATLVFAAAAAFGAIGAYLQNKRQANAAERSIKILDQQVKDAAAEAIEQRRIAQESLDETRKSANAAKESADNAALTMRLSHYAHLEMVDWKVESDGEYVAYEGQTLVNSRPNFLYISCRIVNAGNIPATMYSIETLWGPNRATVNPSATVIPLSVGYIYRHTIDMSLFPPTPNSANEHLGGTISGEIRYEHFFGKRIRHFHQLFWWKKSTGGCGIDPMEGAGNNDEPDPKQSAN